MSTTPPAQPVLDVQEPGARSEVNPIGPILGQDLPRRRIATVPQVVLPSQQLGGGGGSAREDSTPAGGVAIPRKTPPKFHGVVESFVDWVRRFAVYAKISGFMSVLLGKPIVDLSATYWESGDVDKEDMNFYNYALLAQWALYEACSDVVFITIINNNRDRVDLAWKAIEAEYRPRTIARTRLLLKQFINCEFETGSNPVHFLDRVERIACELGSIDAALPERIVLSHFIEKLSDDYDVIKQMFGGESINRQNLISHVSSRHAEMIVAGEKSTPMYARHSKEITCYNCGRKGHLFRECKQPRQPERKPRAGSSSSSGSQGSRGSKKRSDRRTPHAITALAAIDDDDEVVGETFFASVGSACTEFSARRSNGAKGRTTVEESSRGTMCGTGVSVDFESYAFAVSQGRRLNLESLPRISGLPKAEIWSSDSGSSEHLVNSTFGVKDYKRVEHKVVNTASGHPMRVIGTGNMQLLFLTNGIVTPVELTNVLVVPEAKINLFSLSAWDRSGFEFVGGDRKLQMLDGKLVFPLIHNLYMQGAYRTTRKFIDEAERNAAQKCEDSPNDDASADDDLSSSNEQVVSASVESSAVEHVEEPSVHTAVLAPSRKPDTRSVVDVNDMHQSYGHVNVRLLANTAKSLGVKMKGKLRSCSGCSQSKGLRYPIRKKSTVRATRRLERVMCDVIGPKSVKTIEGQSYAVLFRDDYSRFSWVYLLRTKGQVVNAFERFLADVKTEGTIDVLRSDNGGEFTSEAFSKLCDSRCIKREFTTPRTPELNGSVERVFSILDVTQRAARIQAQETYSGLPAKLESLWGEGLRWAVDSFNRTATTANPRHETPFRRYYGREADLLILPFLRPAFYRREKTRKDEPRAVSCFFLGPARNHPTGTVRVLVKSTMKVAITRDMTWPDLPSTSTPDDELLLPDSGGKTNVESIVTDDEEVKQSEYDDDGESYEEFSDGGKTVWHSDVARGSCQSSASSPSPDSSSPDRNSRTPRDERSMPLISNSPPRNVNFGDAEEEKVELPSAEPSAEPPVASTSAGSRVARSAREKKRLKSYNIGPSDVDQQVLGRTRSQTHSASEENSQSRSYLSARSVEDDKRLIDVLEYESTRNVAFIAHDQFDLSSHSPIGKKIEAVGNAPNSYAELKHSPYKEVWKEAMAREIEGLVAKNTFTVSELPPDRKAISGRWVFHWKTSEHGEVTRAKCRLVARGFLQEKSLDFCDTYSPTPRAASIRMLAGVAVKTDQSLHHLDIAQAFIQADLQEEIYMKIPPGCGDLSGRIMRLNKTLYGLKQASLEFNKLLSKNLLDLGFEQSASDPCVFRLPGSQGQDVEMLLVCHVDDIMVCGSDAKVKWLVEKLNESLKTNHLGEVSHYNGCVFVRDRKAGTLKIHQKVCIDKLVERFSVTMSCRSPSTPSLSVRAKEVTEESFDGPFRNLVGGLMWVASMTRPEIADAVRQVARQAHDPAPRHWNAALKILKYLRGTSDLRVNFSREGADRLSAYVDASFGDKNHDRKSASGAVVLFAGGAVSWFSRTQTCVSLSTSEAEYVALSEALKEIIFLRAVLAFMKPGTEKRKVVIYEDNVGAVRLANNPLSSVRSKHIDIRYHFIRNEVKEGRVIVKHVKADEQHADILTKPMTLETFLKHRKFICGS